MSEYSGFILVNRNTLGPSIFVGYHRMSENSGVGLHKLHCISILVDPQCGVMNCPLFLLFCINSVLVDRKGGVQYIALSTVIGL